MSTGFKARVTTPDQKRTRALYVAKSPRVVTMWPFHQTPTARLQHRFLRRLRSAYVITEDLPSHPLANNNPHLLGKASQDAADDEVLFQHWFGTPMPLPLRNATTLECKAWEALLHQTHGLVTQGYYPDAYQTEAEKLQPIGHVLQDLLHYQLTMVTHPSRPADENLLRALTTRLNL